MSSLLTNIRFKNTKTHSMHVRSRDGHFMTCGLGDGKKGRKGEERGGKGRERTQGVG